MRRLRPILTSLLASLVLGPGARILLAQAGAPSRGDAPLTASPTPGLSVRALEPGKPVDGELEGRSTHAYVLSLSRDQYLHLVAEQHGIDLSVFLFSPEGRLLGEFESENGSEGPELLFWLVEASGDYRAELRAASAHAQPGKYTVRIEELRPATEVDILALAAPTRRKKAFDFDASRETVMSADLSRYRYVHFATHGILNAVHPELSGVVLSLVDRHGHDREGF